MHLKEAKDQIAKFEHLNGYHSHYYQSKIELVFVSFKDQTFAQIHYDDFKQGINPFHTLPSDERKFTIVAALENGKIISIKSIVTADKIKDLDKDVEVLEGMD